MKKKTNFVDPDHRIDHLVPLFCWIDNLHNPHEKEHLLGQDFVLLSCLVSGHALGNLLLNPDRTPI